VLSRETKEEDWVAVQRKKKSSSRTDVKVRERGVVWM
jgi:hypothetical protein